MYHWPIWLYTSYCYSSLTWYINTWYFIFLRQVPCQLFYEEKERERVATTPSLDITKRLVERRKKREERNIRKRDQEARETECFVKQLWMSRMEYNKWE